MSLDELLERASGPFETYHPSHLIAAVNALVPLGKERALQAIDDFLAKHDLGKDPHHGMFLVLRVLFDADPHPPMALGGSQPAPPPSSTVLPRFPIAIIEDVPVMLVEHYVVRGLVEPVTTHVAYYRAHGALRDRPLSPSASHDRMAAFQALYHRAYGVAPSMSERAFVKAQLGRMGQ